MAMAMSTMSAPCTTLHAAPRSTSTALWLSGEGGGGAFAAAPQQCRCGSSSSKLFGTTPLLRLQRQSRALPQRRPVQPSAVKYEYKSSQNPSDISQAPLASTSSLSLIKNARIEAQPQDLKLRVRVELAGKDTQRAFDTVVRSLAKNAPPVPGFRKAKGGKTSIVPTSVLLNMMGVSRVRKFVIEEIVRTVLVEYVEKEGIKAKKSLATDQNADELNAIFEPGQDFSFDATLDLEEDAGDADATPSEVASSEAAKSEVVSA